MQFLTQVVPTWVHVGDAADLLQDDPGIVGAIQREQWGGPMTVGQEANLGWGGQTQSWGGWQSEDDRAYGERYGAKGVGLNLNTRESAVMAG